MTTLVKGIWNDVDRFKVNDAFKHVKQYVVQIY